MARTLEAAQTELASALAAWQKGRDEYVAADRGAGARTAEENALDVPVFAHLNRSKDRDGHVDYEFVLVFPTVDADAGLVKAAAISGDVTPAYGIGDLPAGTRFDVSMPGLRSKVASEFESALLSVRRRRAAQRNEWRHATGDELLGDEWAGCSLHSAEAAAALNTDALASSRYAGLFRGAAEEMASDFQRRVVEGIAEEMARFEASPLDRGWSGAGPAVDTATAIVRAVNQTVGSMRVDSLVQFAAKLDNELAEFVAARKDA